MIAAFAVVVSLLYVGYQVRENTNQIDAASLESGTDFIRGLNNLTTSEDSAKLVLAGLSDFDALSPSPVRNIARIIRRWVS